MSDTAKIVRTTTALSAATAVLLSPIPFADELVLLGVYAGMSLAIGKTFALSPREVPWRPIAKRVVGGLAARAAVSGLVGFIPGVAAIANAVSAAALTRAVGAYVVEQCRARAAVDAPPSAESAEPSVVPAAA